MSLRNAFADLVTQPIAERLNQVIGTLSQLSVCLDRSAGRVRASVNTVDTVSNQTSLGGINASSMVPDSLATRWATSIRGRIN